MDEVDDVVVAAGEPVLELCGVGVDVDGRPILDGVDLTVRPGEQWVVIGPNGGGKSTLLQVAGLARHPSRGVVRVLGHELGRVDIRPLRARIGTSSSALAVELRGRLTANEIVRCGRFGALEPWWHHYEPADFERADDLLAQVGLAAYGSRSFATLSTGERQRVLLARTLMPSPELVLLDEPTAGLDFRGREDLVSALEAMAADPAAPPSVLVTHHVEDIPTSATHLLAIAGGKSVVAGPLADHLTATLLSDLFGLPVHLTHSPTGRWSATKI